MAKSNEYMVGFRDALIFAGDIFESRAKSIYARKWLRMKDIQLVVGILDAAFRARYKLAEFGPRGLNLVLCRDGSFEFREIKSKEKSNNDNSP